MEKQEQKCAIYQKAICLIKPRPLFGSILEEFMLRELNYMEGWLPEKYLYGRFMPLGQLSSNDVLDLADKYDGWVESMKAKHNLWSFIPKKRTEDVILCTFSEMKKRRRNGRFVGVDRKLMELYNLSVSPEGDY